MSKFIDSVIIRLKAGNGGPGSVHLHREKYVPRGGPDGGDGGDGGDVYIKLSPRHHNLNHFKPNRLYYAKNGSAGMKQKKFGKKGGDLFISVPPGSVISVNESGEILLNADQYISSREDSKYLICSGGKGGRGNVHFASSVNQTPRYAQPGLPGEQKTIKIDLKLIADIGFIGLPNAGKSTLLSKLTNATPKIAAYQFTTLIPQLGTIILEGDSCSFMLKLADIPGIIKGASLGSGLGLSFLQHIERVFINFFIISMEEGDPIYALKILHDELKSYSEKLIKKSFVVIFNKMDLINATEQKEIKKLYSKEINRAFRENVPEIIFISALKNEGLDKIKEVMLEKFLALKHENKTKKI